LAKAAIRFVLNGRKVTVYAPPAKSLLRLLREDLGLAGAKPGCESGECGACTVLLDGRPVTSCMVLSAQVEGREVTTIEGLDEKGELEELKRAFVEEGAVQCGYCIPGFVVTSYALIRDGRVSEEGPLKKLLEGNICRCGGYPKIISAVMKASKRWRRKS
jgi:carbon-monoxide dehydrogenase small subunit